MDGLGLEFSNEPHTEAAFSFEINALLGTAGERYRERVGPHDPESRHPVNWMDHSLT